MGKEGLRHRVFGFAAIGWAISATAAHAQDSQATGVAPPAIPAAQPPQTVPLPADNSALDPESPLSEMPDLGVDWPDLNAKPADEPPPATQPAPAPPTSADQPASPAPPAQGEEVSTQSPTPAKPDAQPAAQADISGSFRYTVKLDGLDEATAEHVTTRFNALSVLHANQKKAANVAQIDRRAREDGKLLEEILRAEGYYDANVDPGVAASGGDGLLVTLTARPGQLYHFTSVDVTGLSSTGDKQASLMAALGLKTGDAINADAVINGQTALTAKLGEEGYPFPKLEEPKIVVDHDLRSGTFSLAVETGGARNFGKIVVPPGSIFKADHVWTIARFDPGDPYQASRIDDLRRALIQTGLISSVKIEPLPGATDDTVDLSVKLERAPPRTISGELGYGTGEGARAAVSWQHRNLISPEGAVTLRAVLGTQEQSFGATLRQSNFNRRDHVLTAQAIASHVNRNAYDAKSLDIGAGIERQTNIIFQKKWSWSLGGDMTLSDERDTVGPTATPRRRTFFIASLPGTLSYDGTDDLLNPTQGFRLSGRLSPEVSFQSGTFVYGRTQIDASGYQPVSDRVVLAGRVRLGTIIGASADRIAPSRRFYSGGGGSVRGYGYQLIGPRDANNDPIGGRSLAEFGAEARVRFGALGIVPFIDAGNIYRSEYPKFSGMRYGTGLGFRYYTNFGPIRLDVGTPINPQPGDSRVTVYVSLGQAF